MLPGLIFTRNPLRYLTGATNPMLVGEIRGGGAGTGQLGEKEEKGGEELRNVLCFSLIYHPRAWPPGLPDYHGQAGAGHADRSSRSCRRGPVGAAMG